MKKEIKTYSTATITKIDNLEEIRKETREFIEKHKEAFKNLKNK